MREYPMKAYGCWKGDPKGRPYNPTYCMQAVWRGRGSHGYQCERKATKDGWCYQHHPDAVSKRRREQEERYKREQENAPWRIQERLEARIQELKEALRRNTALLEEILSGMTAANSTKAIRQRTRLSIRNAKRVLEGK